jgi:hypothetical protein
MKNYSEIITKKFYIIEEDSLSPTMKAVACPHCAHTIQIPADDGGDIDQETTANKRKKVQTKIEKPKTIKVRTRSLLKNLFFAFF